MQKRTKLQQQLLVAGCATMMMASSGCRSAMPKWNMFSWRNTPSAETLAGNGPSITYPAPPSESATPDAIASVAGGTTGSPAAVAVVASNPSPTTPVTGFDVSTSPVTSSAAARANGFNVASNRTPSTTLPAGAVPGYATGQSPVGQSPVATRNSAVPAIPAGYQFGTKKAAPTATAATSSSYVMPSSYPAPGAATPGPSPSTPSAYSLPGAALPSSAPSASASAKPSSFGMPATVPTGAPTASAAPGGFALPDSMVSSVKAAANGATNAQPFTPKAPGIATQPTLGAQESIAPPTGIKLPGNTSSSTPATTVSTGGTTPSFSTASASLSPRSTAPSDNSSNGYAPGSTGASTAYPTTSGYPSTGTDGSFYR